MLTLILAAALTQCPNGQCAAKVKNAVHYERVPAATVRTVFKAKETVKERKPFRPFAKLFGKKKGC